MATQLTYYVKSIHPSFLMTIKTHIVAQNQCQVFEVCGSESAICCILLCSTTKRSPGTCEEEFSKVRWKSDACRQLKQNKKQSTAMMMNLGYALLSISTSVSGSFLTENGR